MVNDAWELAVLSDRRKRIPRLPPMKSLVLDILIFVACAATMVRSWLELIEETSGVTILRNRDTEFGYGPWTKQHMLFTGAWLLLSVW